MQIVTRRLTAENSTRAVVLHAIVMITRPGDGQLYTHAVSSRPV
jgi:hypothetical protein